MATGGIIGPVAFVTAWVVCGRATAGYSPRGDAISDLAAIGASTRLTMTLGFVVFGVGVALYSRPLGQLLGAPTGWAAAVCGLATLGVAAVPLGWISDGLHGTLAALGYAGLAATPLLASAPLRRRGRLGAAGVSVATAVVCALCLVATAFARDHGLFQRLGLTIGDVWLVVSAAVILIRQLPVRSGPPGEKPARFGC
jgi:hypothetical membrane protein